ncbi:MAG: menaquinone reductase iron-sulfur cluster-binding subunit QrcC [Thermodesulfobacteriota bacterium]
MQKKPEHTTTKRYGMVIDLDKCIGCGACMVACYQENNIPFRADESDKMLSTNWIRVYKITNDKPFPDTEVAYIPKPCMQCDGLHGDGHSPCVSVCPAVATDYDVSTGIVSQIPTRCFGCRYCMAACPYHARKFNWWDPVWPAEMEKYLNPDVSPRMRGVVEKCSFCFHRYQQARDKAYFEGRDEIREDEYQPACVEQCPTNAMVFGDLLNPEHAVSKLKDSKYAFQLLARLKTHPKVYYLSKRKWVHAKADNYLEDENVTFEKKQAQKKHHQESH